MLIPKNANKMKHGVSHGGDFAMSVYSSSWYIDNRHNYSLSFKILFRQFGFASDFPQFNVVENCWAHVATYP